MKKRLSAPRSVCAGLIGATLIAAGIAVRPSHAQTAPAAPAAQASVPAAARTISTGQNVDLARARQPNAPTVFVFYSASSSAERALVETLTRRAGAGTVGLRLVRLFGLDAPAAKQHAITETPTVLVWDRFGHTLARTSKMDEINAAVIGALKMARLKWVDESDPAAPDVYKELGGGRAGVPDILKTMSLQPGWMDLVNRLANTAHFSDTALPRRTKEMIATYVSGINGCKY